MTRDELGAAIAALLTDEQVAQIEALHDEIDFAWLDGCAAHGEGADCCIDAITKAYDQVKTTTEKSPSEVDHA